MITKLRYIIVLMLTLSQMMMFADIPAGYYTSIEGKSNQALKDQLEKVINPHTQLSYGSLWTYFPYTDVYPELYGGRKRVWDMYSNIVNYYPYTSASGLNREHCVPKSWWGTLEGQPVYSDLNNLYPSNGVANQAKLNYPLGDVSEATFDNGVSKVGYAVAGQGGGSTRVFAPADEYKGAFARTYFYMATCYQSLNWTNNWMMINTNYLNLKPWAINLLLEWSRNDPVSEKELNRNEEVYKYQGNRNPFIDYPILIELLWGNRKGEAFQSGDIPTGDPVLINPVVGSTLNFGEVALGSTQKLEIFVKGENLRGSVTLTLYSGERTQFRIPTT